MSDQKSKAFLSRWSERKQQVQTDRQAASQANEQVDVRANHPTPVEAPAGDELGIPAPRDSLLSDVSSDSQSNAEDTNKESSSTSDTALLAHNQAGGQVNDESSDESSDEASDEVLLSDDDMPAIDSLAANSDLSAFFNKGVSATLRKAALRHVFQLPQYNVRDGLNDYDGDYTVFEPLGDTITSDMKWHIARKERERLEAEERALQEREALQLENDENALSADADNESELSPENESPENESPSSEHHAQTTDNGDAEELLDESAEDSQSLHERGEDLEQAEHSMHSESDDIAESFDNSSTQVEKNT